jgi:dCMP deaminase
MRRYVQNANGGISKKMNKWDYMYMEMAERAAQESKCAARKVGCLIVKDSNILAVGINGTMPGETNCCDLFEKRYGFWYHKHENGELEPDDTHEAHHQWSLVHEIHAEMNAMAKAHKNGVSVEGATIYVNYSPCFNCAKQLIVHGIKRVVFREIYDGLFSTSSKTGVRHLLAENGVELERWETEK